MDVAVFAESMRHHVMRVTAVTLAIVVLASSPASADERTTLRLWNYRPPNVRSVTDSIERQIFVRFVESHPEIAVTTSHALSFMSGTSEMSRFMALAAGTAPNVLMLSTRQLPLYIDQGMLVPLDEYLVSYEPWQEMSNEFIEAATVGGKQYAVPVIHRVPEIYSSYTYVKTNETSVPPSGSLALIYRKDMFAELGLDPYRPPQTWDELYEFARRLTRRNVKVTVGPMKGMTQEMIYGLGLAKGREAGFQFSNFVWQNGGEMAVREDGRWRCAFDSPKGIVALEFLQKLAWEPFEKDGERYEGVACVGGFGVDPLPVYRFQRGEVAMILDNPRTWLEREAREPHFGLTTAIVGVAPLPAGKAGQVHNTVKLCWAITRQSADPEVNRAAWEYIEYLNSEETSRYYVAAMVEAGQESLVPPHHLLHFGFRQEYENISPQFRTIEDDIAPSVRYEPPIPEWQQVSEVELGTALDRALTVGPDIDAGAVLHEAARRADALLLHRGSDTDRRQKRMLAGIVLVVAGVGMILVFTRLRRMLAINAPQSTVAHPPRLHTQLTAWLYLLPALLSIAIWGYFPLMRGLGMAFYDYRLFAPKKLVWLDNFANAFGQPLFWEVLGNTLQYVLMTLALGFIAPITLALLVTEVPRGKYMFRILYYLPAVIAPVVAMIMWRALIYDPEPWGWLNRAIGLAGIPPQRWLDDPHLAMPCIVLTSVWATAGPGSLIYIAALKNIPEEVYEAADLDNAGIFRKVFSITLPYLTPLILINFIGAFVGAFQAAQNIFVMTEGGPVNTTRTLGLEIFFNGFLYLKFGYATAMAWIMGAMLVGFTLYNLRILQNIEFKRAN